MEDTGAGDRSGLVERPTDGMTSAQKGAGMPSIRHVAIRCKSPSEMAEFYKTVFELEEVWRAGDGRVVYLTDGVINLALLPPPAEGSEEKTGINHFGFEIEDLEEIKRRMELMDVPEPKQSPRDGRRYAEFRGLDPEGNGFDLSEKGWTISAPPGATSA